MSKRRKNVMSLTAQATNRVKLSSIPANLLVAAIVRTSLGNRVEKGDSTADLDWKRISVPSPDQEIPGACVLFPAFHIIA